MIVRDLLVSIQPEDLSNRNVLPTKAIYFYAVFSTIKTLESLQVTNNRKENLASKRHEKYSQGPVTMPPLTSQVPLVWVGPPAPPQSEEETRRAMSISDLSKSSAGSKLFHACQEIESQMLGNLFCEVTITALFGEEAALSWVGGRPEPPVIQWRARYFSTLIALTVVPLPRKSN